MQLESKSKPGWNGLELCGQLDHLEEVGPKGQVQTKAIMCLSEAEATAFGWIEAPHGPANEPPERGGVLFEPSDALSEGFANEILEEASHFTALEYQFSLDWLTNFNPRASEHISLITALNCNFCIFLMFEGLCFSSCPLNPAVIGIDQKPYQLIQQIHCGQKSYLLPL